MKSLIADCMVTGKWSEDEDAKTLLDQDGEHFIFSSCSKHFTNLKEFNISILHVAVFLHISRCERYVSFVLV